MEETVQQQQAKIHKTWQDYGREWLDTLVVAISVAMCFRAYFYEPFKIPTGSMQETLWGYHTVREEVKVKGEGEGGGGKVEDQGRGLWDVFPLSILKWAVTGETYVDYKAPATGSVRARNRGDGFADIAVGTSPKTFKLPTDAVQPIFGKFFNEGDTVWKGRVITGDFIFVNRWKWNFWKPRDGQVMIFSTTGIAQLPQGTHYIKRMKARPGEKYVLEHPVEGRPTEVTMGANEYFACGDNFNNSFDSRYWGPVPAENLRGEASIVFWPITGWRIIR